MRAMVSSFGAGRGATGSVGGNAAVLRVIPCWEAIPARGAVQRRASRSGGVREGERWHDPGRVGTGPVGINARADAVASALQTATGHAHRAGRGGGADRAESAHGTSFLLRWWS